MFSKTWMVFVREPGHAILDFEHGGDARKAGVRLSDTETTRQPEGHL
jgi:hypothetical protein